MLQQHADQKQHRHGHRKRQQRIDAEAAGEEEADIHADHHELALGEVHDFHDAEDQRHADAHKRIDAAYEQAVHDGLCQCLQHRTGVEVQVFISGWRASSFGNTLARSPFCHCTPTGRPYTFLPSGPNFTLPPGAIAAKPEETSSVDNASRTFCGAVEAARSSASAIMKVWATRPPAYSNRNSPVRFLYSAFTFSALASMS